MLGKQNVASLAKAGIRGIAINSETATAASFSVRALKLKNKVHLHSILKAIGSFQYDAIVISPEQMMKPNGDFEKLLKNPLFTS